MEGHGAIRSVNRAMDILSYVAEKDCSSSLAEISRDLGLSMSTTHRLLACLQAGGIVERDAGNHYRLGPSVFKWARSPSYQGTVAALALPFLYELRDLTRETTSFHLLVSRHVVCVEKVDSHNPHRVMPRIGETLPLGIGAVSKVVLTYLAENQRTFILRLCADHGVRHMDPEALEQELNAIRRRGFALSLGEVLADVASASAPIFNSRGRIMGAIAVSGPMPRLSLETLEAHALDLKEIAGRLSVELGHRPEELPIDQSRDEGLQPVLPVAGVAGARTLHLQSE